MSTNLNYRFVHGVCNLVSYVAYHPRSISSGFGEHSCGAGAHLGCGELGGLKDVSVAVLKRRSYGLGSRRRDSKCDTDRVRWSSNQVCLCVSASEIECEDVPEERTSPSENRSGIVPSSDGCRAFSAVVRPARSYSQLSDLQRNENRGKPYLSHEASARRRW